MIHQTLNPRVQIIESGGQFRLMLDNQLHDVFESLSQVEYHAQKLVNTL